MVKKKVWYIDNTKKNQQIDEQTDLFYWFNYFTDLFALKRPWKRTQSKLVWVGVVERESLHWTQGQAVVNNAVSGGRGENPEECGIHKRLRKSLTFQTKVDDWAHWTFVHYLNSELDTLSPLHLRLLHRWFAAFALTFEPRTYTYNPIHMPIYKITTRSF